MPLLIKKKTAYKRKNYKTGVVKTNRDSYSNAKGEWKTHSKTVKTLDGRCLDCSIVASKTKEGYLVVHHIKPLSRGGLTKKINLVTLCERCHSLRHDHL